jgi:hypothetical protein
VVFFLIIRHALLTQLFFQFCEADFNDLTKTSRWRDSTGGGGASVRGGGVDIGGTGTGWESGTSSHSFNTVRPTLSIDHSTNRRTFNLLPHDQMKKKQGERG